MLSSGDMELPSPSRCCCSGGLVMIPLLLHQVVGLDWRNGAQFADAVASGRARQEPWCSPAPSRATRRDGPPVVWAWRAAVPRWRWCCPASCLSSQTLGCYRLRLDACPAATALLQIETLPPISWMPRRTLNISAAAARPMAQTAGRRPHPRRL